MNITTQGKNTDLFLMFWRRCSYSRQKCPPSLYNLYFDSFLLICTSFVVRTRGFLCVVYLLFRLANYKDPCHYADMSLVPKQLGQSYWEQRKLCISFPLQISKPLSCVFNKTVFLIKNSRVGWFPNSSHSLVLRYPSSQCNLLHVRENCGLGII